MENNHIWCTEASNAIFDTQKQYELNKDTNQRPLFFLSSTENVSDIPRSRDYKVAKKISVSSLPPSSLVLNEPSDMAPFSSSLIRLDTENELAQTFSCRPNSSNSLNCFATTSIDISTGAKIIRTNSKTFSVKSTSIQDFPSMVSSSTSSVLEKEVTGNKCQASGETTEVLENISGDTSLDANNGSQKESISVSEKDDSDNFTSIITHPLLFLNKRIQGFHLKTGKWTKPLHREKSKSLTDLRTEDVECEQGFQRKHASIFPKPSFRIFSFDKEDKQNIPDHDSFDLPSSTPLVIPQHLSGAPAIFLCRNTPEASPAESPIHTPDRTIDEAVCPALDDDSLDDGPKCIEDILLLDKTSNSLSDEEEEKVAPRVNFGYISSLKKRVIKRPILKIQASTPCEDDDSLPRRNSVMSSLSVMPPSRRPSLTSLLSISPSVSLAGRRFSFNLGSRSDQMVSVSFKSLESFVNEDNLEGLRSFLSSRSVVIDDRDENGATVLMLCAAKGKVDFCKELLSHGADVNAEDNDMWTSLITAAKEGHHNVVSALLENDAVVDHRDLGGWTAFMWACYKGHLETAKVLLAYGSDPNAQGQHHMTPLVWAAGRGHTQIIKLLLEKGTKVNLCDKFGTTALIWACRKGFIEIAEDLLNSGASVDSTGMYSWTSLIVATKGNYVDLANLLLEHKPNVNSLDKDGGTALTIACKEGYAEIASALLRAGAYVNIQDRNGDSNLIYAARGGHRSVVEALLKKHADIDCVGKEHKTALYWAVEKGHTQVVKLLLSANADLEHATKEGDTALLRSVRTKNAEIVQMFVDKKARVNVADKKGDTALHIAMRGRSKRIVEILLRNPKNSQMLYRPNRAGETPYNIDLSHQKTILGQIFGARRLNTNEENENMLGYDLYSSSLADILSEPSLSMPISVGLYARWGSGKSFLIRKLREEMNSFARQWVEPLFQFTPLVFFLVAFTSILIGFITMVATGMWYVGLGTGGGLFCVFVLLLMGIWYGSRSKYDWNLWYKWSVALASQMAAFKLVAQVIFCSPPGNQWKEWKEGVQAKPLKFIFAEGAKPSSTGAGGNSVVQILGSMFDKLENQYGIFPTRFYRAFRPKAFGTSSPWKYRRLCGIPYIAIFFITLGCALTLTYLAVTYGFHEASEAETQVVEMQKRWVTSLPNLTEGKKLFLTRRNIRFDDDDDDDDDDDFDEKEEQAGSKPKENEDGSEESSQGLHGRLITPLLFILSALVALVIVANIHTLVRMVKALIFSHRRHLLSAISKFDTMTSEGYVPTLKEEVSLLIEMVRCLDSFTAQQTRLVVILDGLDSCEQEKVLSVLDAVHTLFTDSSGPFIILLAIDPHIITKAIELNATKVFRESSFSGHDYLRNIIHLPFYLQNAGLRKVKLAEQASEHLKGRSQSSWNEQETEFVSLAMTSAMGGLHHMPENRRMSGESGMSLSVARRTQSSRGTRRLKPSDSVGSSIASNLHRVSAASDLNKVLLTDDYFNDINPRSMRRLMNVVYITGRLLKAFHIEFNWYHLALWVNITEQWPYHASWLIHIYEKKEDSVDEKTTLKELYEKLKGQIPASKEMEPLLEMDKDDRKLETFLAMHENVLHVYNLVIFLPFTINLDPYIKKKIKEEQIQMEENYARIGSPTAVPWQLSHPRFDPSSKSSSLPWSLKGAQNMTKDFSSTLPPTLNPLMWGYPQPPYPPQPVQSLTASNMPYNPQSNIPTLNTLSLPSEAHDKKLSSLSIDEVFQLFEKVEGVSTNMLPSYKEKLTENNVNGKVLLHCSLDDLKQILKMTFGDWELFKMLILGLREQELNQDDDLLPRNFRYLSNQLSDPLSQHQPDSLSENSDVSLLTDGMKRGSLRSSFSNKDREDPSTGSSRRSGKHALHSKQVTLEEQMIFGALQTLNEEAYEDVMEEQMKQEIRKSSLNIDGADEENWHNNSSRGRKGSVHSLGKGDSAEEIDVVYIQSSPLLPHTIVSCPPESDSTAPSIASSFSPYKGSVSLSRTSSLRGGSVNASPKHSFCKAHSHSTVDSKESTPKYKNSPSLETTGGSLQRERPNSLNLSQAKEEDSGVISDVTNDVICIRFSPDHDSPHSISLISQNSEYIPSENLDPSAVFHNGPKNVSFSDPLSTGSYSLERLRKLTKKLQKVLGSQDNADERGGDIDCVEASPLVTSSLRDLRTPSLSPGGIPNDIGSAVEVEDAKPLVKVNNNVSSHVITITKTEKETHV